MKPKKLIMLMLIGMGTSIKISSRASIDAESEMMSSAFLQASAMSEAQEIMK